MPPPGLYTGTLCSKKVPLVCWDFETHCGRDDQGLSLFQHLRQIKNMLNEKGMEFMHKDVTGEVNSGENEDVKDEG